MGPQALEAAAAAGASGAIWSDHGPPLVEGERERALPLRLDLDPAALEDQGPLRVVATRAMQPDLIGLPVTGTQPSQLRACLDAAEREEVEVVLLVHEPRDAPLAVTLAAGSEAVVGFSLKRFDEDALDTLAAHDHLGLLTAAPEFASAFRRGAGGLEGFPASMSLAAGRWLLDLCHADVKAALHLERRLLRFLEGHLRPAARRLLPGSDDPARPSLEGALHAAVGGWLEAPKVARGAANDHLAALATAGVDPLALRAVLLDQVPELTPHVG